MPSAFTHPLERVAREPHVCIWEITSICNLDCVHCENHAARPGPCELPLDHLLRVGDSLRQLGCRTVDVTGGEPLLRADWDALCAHLSALGLDVALITNGLLLDERAIRRAEEAGVKMVAVSVDGLQRTHDATRRRRHGGGSPWRDTLTAIERARGRLPIAAITQVNRENLDELPDLGRVLNEAGVAHWQLQLAIPNARLLARATPYAIAPEDLRQLTAFIVGAAADPSLPEIHTSDTIGYCSEHEPVLRRKASGPGLWIGCVAGIRAVAIKADGTVRGCSLMPPDFDAGNLHTEPLEVIWGDARRFAYSTRFDPGVLTGECGRCGLGPLCRAGCSTMAYWVTGTIGDNPYCLRRVP